MYYSDFKAAMEVVDTHLSSAATYVEGDDVAFYVYVGEQGWPSRIGTEAITGLEDAGWKFEGNIDAWKLSS